MKVLILGVNGMLGRMVYHFLSKNSPYSVSGTSRKKNKNKNSLLKHFEVKEYLKNPHKFSYIKRFDYIINCIGIINSSIKDEQDIQDAIAINALFPHNLSSFTINQNVKIIQIATDCVFSGRRGDYTEGDLHDCSDIYGKTKSLGEVEDNNFLNIRCSIIGPYTKANLMEWFFSNPPNSTVEGFFHHKWNGVTTLQFAQLCKKIIEKNIFLDLTEKSHIYHFVPNDKTTKYDLLVLMNQVFERKVTIKKINKKTQIVDRTLETRYSFFTNSFGGKGLLNALVELRDSEGF